MTTVVQAESTAVSDSSSVTDAVLETMMDGRDDMTHEGRGASFDDLDDIDQARSEFVNSKKREINERRKGDVKKEKPVEETKQAKVEGKKDDKKAKEESDDDAQERGRAPEKKGKTYKVVNDDQSYDIPPEAKITIPVDGKKQEVAIKDLVKLHNDQTVGQRKFDDLSKKAQEFQRLKYQSEEIIGTANKFVELSQKDPVQAIHYILDRANQNPQTFFKTFTEKFFGDLDALAEMSPEERRIHRLEKENQFLQERGQTFLERSNEEKLVRQYQREIEQAKQSYGISDSVLEQAHDLTAQEWKAQGKPLSKMGVGDIVETAKDLMAIDKTKSILADIDDDLASDQDTLATVFRFIRDPSNADFTDEEIAEFVRDSLGLEVARQLQPKTSTQTFKKQSRSLEEADPEEGLFSDWE